VNATEEKPIFWSLDQPMASGIFPHVLPFLRIALVIAQPVMESNPLQLSFCIGVYTDIG